MKHASHYILFGCILPPLRECKLSEDKNYDVSFIIPTLTSAWHRVHNQCFINARIKSNVLLSPSQILNIKGQTHPSSSGLAKPRTKSCFGHQLPGPLTQGKNICTVPLKLIWSGWLTGRQDDVLRSLSPSIPTAPGLRGLRGSSGAFSGTPTATPTRTHTYGWSPRPKQALCLGWTTGHFSIVTDFPVSPILFHPPSHLEEGV